MAIATQLVIGTGSKMSANYQSQDFSVTLSWDLERGDTDLPRLAEEKAEELESLHSLIRKRVMEMRAADRPPVEDKPRRAKAEKKTAASEVVAETLQAAETMQAEMPAAAEPETSPEPVQEENSEEAKPSPAPLELPITGPQRQAIGSLRLRLGWTDESLSRLVYTRFGTPELDRISHRQAGVLLTELQRRVASANTNRTHGRNNGVPNPQGEMNHGKQNPSAPGGAGNRVPALNGAGSNGVPTAG